MVQLSHPYMTTGKTIALTRWTLVHLVMSLMFPQPTEGASFVTQMVENLPEMWETWARSLDREGPLVEGMATRSSILAWRIPQRSLVGYSPWGGKESNMTKRLLLSSNRGKHKLQIRLCFLFSFIIHVCSEHYSSREGKNNYSFKSSDTICLKYNI